MLNFDDIATNRVGRRDFLAKLGIGVAGVAALSVGCGAPDATNPGNGNANDGGGTRPGTTTGTTTGATTGGAPGSTTGGTQTTYFDAANFPGVPGRSENGVVLNFALTLELLESNLYAQALNLASGRDQYADLDPAGPGAYTRAVGRGSIATEEKANIGFNTLAQNAYIERSHAEFITNTLIALGETPVGPNPNGYVANFGTDLSTILTVVRTLEEEGTRAYLGGSKFITDLNTLQAAATIYTTEARHAGAYNYVLGLDPGPAPNPDGKDIAAVPNPAHPNDFEYYRTPTQVLQDAQAYMATGGAR